MGFCSKNTEVGCHALLQGIFLTQESNLCLLHCRKFLYHGAIWEAPLLCLLLTPNGNVLLFSTLLLKWVNIFFKIGV